MEPGAIWLWAFGGDFLPDFGGLCSYGVRAELKLNGDFIATSKVSPTSFLRLLHPPPPQV